MSDTADYSKLCDDLQSSLREISVLVASAEQATLLADVAEESDNDTSLRSQWHLHHGKSFREIYDGRKWEETLDELEELIERSLIICKAMPDIAIVRKIAIELDYWDNGIIKYGLCDVSFEETFARLLQRDKEHLTLMNSELNVEFACWLKNQTQVNQVPVVIILRNALQSLSDNLVEAYTLSSQEQEPADKVSMSCVIAIKSAYEKAREYSGQIDQTQYQAVRAINTILESINMGKAMFTDNSGVSDLLYGADCPEPLEIYARLHEEYHIQLYKHIQRLDCYIEIESPAQQQGQGSGVKLKPVEHTDTERNILTALGNDTLKGEALLNKAGYDYSSHYKSILSNLVKRGILENTKGQGYHKPVEKT